VAAVRDVRLPDIGDFEHVDVVEVLVKAGDRVAKEDSLIVLESDKATMEVPSPLAGVIREMKVAAGDQVSEGDLIAKIEVEAEEEAEESEDQEPDEEDAEQARAAEKKEARGQASRSSGARTERRGRGAGAGDRESGRRARARKTAPPERQRGDETARAEKAEPDEAGQSKRDAAGEPEKAGEAESTGRADKLEAAGEAESTGRAEPAPHAAARAHASPSVRQLARELGVDLPLVPGSGRKGRILREDVQGFVKASLAQGRGGVPIAGVRVAAPVEIDFEKFGPTELQPLNRVRRLASANLHRSWVTVPHVTQFDEADVTELERFRKEQRTAAETRGVKLTFLPFVVKAVTAALREFPHMNASLDPIGENLVVKRYFHIGVAVDTEHGLVVPVLRDADRKGLFALAEELQDLSERARRRRLRPEELQGGSFSISSLGGIGGTFFTPIVNHPEVAILGVSKMAMKPVWQDGSFAPRLVLPLSLSYDHRVIDGADAVRFTRRVSELLSDLRLALL
jgi:pyruvate dehydrogenase E2 component (dihydrolipoamide acetyltransferase)